MALADTNLAGSAGTDEDSAHVDYLPEKVGPPVGVIVLVAGILILVIIALGVWLRRKNSAT